MDETWSDVLRRFRIEPPSREELYSYLLVGGILLALFVIWEIVASIRRKRKILELEWRWFHKMAEAKDLSEVEASALETLAQIYYPKKPQNLLQSVQTFDETVKRFLASVEESEPNEAYADAAEFLESVREKYFFKDYRPDIILNSTRQIPPNHAIRLIIPSDSGTTYLHTTVTENTGEKIILTCKEFASMKLAMSSGSTYTGYYWREKDAGYEFTLKVIKMVDYTNVEFEHAEEFTRKQRRHFFRVGIRLSGRFFKITEKDAHYFAKNLKFPEGTSKDSFPCKIVSLSGGGISFFTQVRCIANELLHLEILVKKGAGFKGIVGRVARIRKFEERYKIYVEFLTVTDQCRNAIIQFVSKHQRTKTIDK